MRILFLAHRLPYPPDKGDKIRSFFELQGLSERHEVDLFCFYDCAEDAQHAEALRPYYRSIYAERLSWVGSRLRAFKAVCRGRSLSLGYFHSDSMQQRVREALETTHYDLIFVFSSSMAQYVEHADTFPRVLDMVDVDSDKWRQYARLSLPPRAWFWSREARLLSQYEKELADRFSLTVLCTAAEAELLHQKAASANIGILTNRVDENYWDPQAVDVPPEISSWQPFVIFTGSMDYLPNADAAVYFYRESLPHLRAMVPKIRFVVVGRNPMRCVRRLASDPAVIVTGTVPDVRPYLLGAVAAVAPLRLARGVQNKVLEAMAMGLPVVTTSKVASALAEELASCLFVEDDPGGMATRLAEIIRYGSPIAPERIRATLFQHCGTSMSQQRLEEILCRVVEKHSGVISLEKRGSFERRNRHI